MKKLCLLAICLMAFGAGAASAQQYPSKPIRLIAPPAGGGNDFTARLMAQGLAGPLGQPVVVINYPSGLGASEAAAKAAPDGYSLLLQGQSLWTGPLFRRASYDPQTSFAPISILVDAPGILVVNPAVPVESVTGLIALAKANPGELNFATGGNGAFGHLAGELFKYTAGINIQRVAYSAAPARLADLFSGRVQIAFDDGMMPHVRSGKVRGLAVTTLKKSELAPGLPTVAESGLPGFQASIITGLFAPAKTPDPIIRRINQETVKFLHQPEVKTKMLEFGTDVVASSPEELGAAVKGEMERFAKVLEAAGIRPE